MKRLAIVGGGPAGLRAAEVAVQTGMSVTVYEAKPSVGRKFLVAGRGGLNLTNDEAATDFTRRYQGQQQPDDLWSSLLADFDAAALRDWAQELGIETFAAGTGRVYPREMKAAPLLRRWVERLRKSGVKFAPHHRLIRLLPATAPIGLDFLVDDQVVHVSAEAVILALGGGSWPQTGSDGKWVETLRALGVTVHSLQSANCGWEVAWSPAAVTLGEGQPLKNISVEADGQKVRGELVLTKYGLEGGPLYQLGAVLRSMTEPMLMIDLKPDHSVEQLAAKMGPVRRGLLREAQARWRLSSAAQALLVQMYGEVEPETVGELAARAKSIILSLTKPRPLDEAISSAGGVCWSELNSDLMLRQCPGIFLAGEMIDWEAPTGGYLLQGCFATGTRAGRGAVSFLAAEKS